MVGGGRLWSGVVGGDFSQTGVCSGGESELYSAPEQANDAVLSSAPANVKLN